MPPASRATVRAVLPALLLSAALTSCGGVGSPPASSPSPTGTAAPTAVPTETPTGTATGTATGSPSSGAGSTGGPLRLVDAVVVATDRSDPLSRALAEAAGSGRTLLLDVVAPVFPPESDLAAGRLVMPGRGAPPGRGTGVDVQAPPEAVSDLGQPLVLITGTFEVSSRAENSYTLEALTTESDPALRPQGPDDAERCASPDTAAAQAAADRLRQDPGARPALREEWGSSPSVWWAVQFEAESPGDLAAALETACRAYRG
ncbi:hypothetical protein NUM3379_24460 [Kineococcus sp. NUM-3379]